jgi:cobalt/nickel transport system ATP-binding protein
MPEYAIEISGLSHTYPDGTQALEGVDLKVARGQTVLLVGPNGAGKTTLLLHLNCVLAGEGEVKVAGIRACGKNAAKIRRKVGIVFQNPDDQLFCPTVYEDVAYGPINLGLPLEEVASRARVSLDAVGLAGFGDRPPHRLSLGEKRRASVATVLSMDPDIILFDEPTANLDPKSSRMIEGIITGLNAAGKTIIVSTHDIDSMAGLADRVVVLDGKVVADGPPRQILMDTELLERSNLEKPQIARLFEVLQAFGYPTGELPLTMDDAIGKLTEAIGASEGRHVHLHVHEHTHRQLKYISQRREHHG